MLGSVTTWLKRPEMIRFKDRHICEKQIETIEKKEDGWYWFIAHDDGYWAKIDYCPFCGDKLKWPKTTMGKK